MATSTAATALLTGGFGLLGALGGVLLNSAMTRGADERRLEAEDQRRWLTDRRAVFAAYLGLAEAILRELDAAAVHLRKRHEPSQEDWDAVERAVAHFFRRWDDDLQPALGEVQLLASPTVADLAERVSWALIEISWDIQHWVPFEDYYSGWNLERDLLAVLRNAMRRELGLPETDDGAFPRDPTWPWLPDRPGCQEYLKDHRRQSIRRHPSRGGPPEAGVPSHARRRSEP